MECNLSRNLPSLPIIKVSSADMAGVMEATCTICFNSEDEVTVGSSDESVN